MAARMSKKTPTRKTTKKRSTKKKAVGRPRKKTASLRKKAVGRPRKKTTSKATALTRKRRTKKKATGGGKKSSNAGSKLPRKGTKVQWRSLPGMVSGTVVAVITKDTTLAGKKIKASKEAPRIKLRSDRGKICFHKPSSVKPAR